MIDLGQVITANPRRARVVVCLFTAVTFIGTAGATVLATNESPPDALASSAAAASGEVPASPGRFVGSFADGATAGSTGGSFDVPADGLTNWMASDESRPSGTGGDDGDDVRNPPGHPKLLLVGQTPLSDAAVRAVRRDNRVDHAITFDGALLQVGNLRTNVLGIDPQRFRTWTPKRTTSDSGLWSGVERGEIMLAPALKPTKSLRAGQAYQVTGEVTRNLQVAGFSDIGLHGIGGLVNQDVGETLGLKPNAGLLVDASNDDLPGLIRSLSDKLGSHARVISLRPLPAAQHPPPVVQQQAPTSSPTDMIRTTWPEEEATLADPTSGGQITPRTYRLLRTLQAAGATNGGVSCWDEHEWAPFSDHPKGKACDVFFDPYDKASVEYGWQIVSWLIQTQATYGMKYVIWQGWYWSAEERVWEPYVSDTYGCPDRRNITGCHYDHIHISMY